MFMKSALVLKTMMRNRVATITAMARRDSSPASAPPPRKWDWRTHGAVTSVKNQGAHRTCYAVAVVAAVESINFIKTGNLVDLSAQEIVDCVPCNTAKKGNVLLALNYVKKHGISYERDYPYRGWIGKCKRKELRRDSVKIDGYKIMTLVDEEALESAVIRQPVLVHIHCNYHEFIHYQNGVHRGPPYFGRKTMERLFELDHFVLVVGMGSEKAKRRGGKLEKPVDYWILKNSWGTSWGMNGYMHLLRNSGRREGICGINIHPIYPIIITPPDPPSFPAAIRQSNIHGNNRRALSVINGNIRGAPLNPSAVQKRGILTAKNAACSKNPVVPVHRPITRKFAAQLAGKRQHPSVEEVKPSVQSSSITYELEDCVIIDAEEYNKSVDDNDVPMFVQHTEAILDEIDWMDAEVEMETVDADEPVVDIDSCDKRNPLAVIEYIDDVYAHYKKTESLSCVPPNYMDQQFDINERMRGILIDWLIEVHYKFELMEETLYLTVNILDRFLSVQSVVRKKLQLVGVTAMLLASKYEEVSVPVVDDLILISDKAYSRQEVLDMEKLMINKLQFNLSVPTPYVFMRRFLKAAQSDRRETLMTNTLELFRSVPILYTFRKRFLKAIAQSGKRMELLPLFLIELSLVQYVMFRFPPFSLSAASLFTTQCTTTQWSKTCERHTNCNTDQLMGSARTMAISLHQKCHAAETELAAFLLNDAEF